MAVSLSAGASGVRFTPRAATWTGAVAVVQLMAQGLKAALAAMACLLATQALAAQVTLRVEGAWARPAQAGGVTTVVMSVTPSAGMAIVGGESPQAQAVELHTMSMSDGVMRMRPLDALPLSAGVTTTLAPATGHAHWMIMGLKQELKLGDTLTLVMRVRLANGQTKLQSVLVPVSDHAPASMGADMPANMPMGH